MPKKVEINQCMNNSNALVAPIRSEIRISIPIPTVNYRLLTKKVFNSVTRSSIFHLFALTSTCVLSAICYLELPVSLLFLITLGIICFVSFMGSFFGILNELGGYKGIMDDIKKGE